MKKVIGTIILLCFTLVLITNCKYENIKDKPKTEDRVKKDNVFILYKGWT